MVGQYALWIALRFALPGALLCCGLLAMWRVSRRQRRTSLVLLGVGAGALVYVALLGTGVGDLMPEFALPALVAAAVVYPLAALAVARSAAPGGRRLSSAQAASTLLILAAVVQFFAPWLLASGE